MALTSTFPCSLQAAKSTVYSDLSAMAKTILTIVEECKMHISFSVQWGIDIAELESMPELTACTAYRAYIMDIGLQGAFVDPPSPGVHHNPCSSV
jgi:hydroxymethylpyrimidine/phosphomethylpyrimidine kinase